MMSKLDPEAEFHTFSHLNFKTGMPAYKPTIDILKIHVHSLDSSHPKYLIKVGDLDPNKKQHPSIVIVC